MPLPYEIHLSLRYLRFHRGRTFLSLITLISVAGVTVGTAALVIALSLMNGMQEDVRQRILKGSAHLTVVSALSPTFDESPGLLETIRNVPGVFAVGPVLYTPAMITDEDLGAPAYAELQGIDPAAHGKVLEAGEGDPFQALSRRAESMRGGIVLGADLAAKLGVASGNLVRILVPRMRLTPFAPLPRSQVFEVVGTYRADAYPQDAVRAWVAIEDAQRLLDAPARASWLEVRLDDLRSLEVMKQRLPAALGPAWQVVDLIEQNADLLKALNTEKLILFLAIGLIVIVASLNIVSTLVLMVADKIREIGTLTAMGAKPGGVATVFMLQGVVIGVLGTAVGLAGGTAIAWYLDAYRKIPLDPDVYYITHVPFSTRGSDLLTVGVLVLLVSFLATLYPAWKAARLDPVEAIRHE